MLQAGIETHKLKPQHWTATDDAQFIAKAFLEKDYEAIKAQKATPQPTEDVIIKDVDQKDPAAQQLPVPEKLEPGAESEKVETKAEEGAAPVPSQPTEATPGPQSGDVEVKKEKEPDSTDRADQAFSESADNVNFDSVLNASGESNFFDLHLDSGNDMGNQAFLSGTAFGNTEPTGTEQPGTSLATGSGTTAAPAGEAEFDLQLQNAGSENPFSEQDGGTDDMMPGESSFDDLFMEAENMGDNGTGEINQLEGDTLMNLNELDDNWF